MKNLVLLSIVAFIGILSGQKTSAEEYKVLHVKRDDSPVTYDLFIDVSSSTDLIQKFVKKKLNQNGEVNTDKFDVLPINTNEGIVLEQVDPHIVLKVESNNFDEQHGGRITLNFLRNGITGAREKYHTDLVKEENGAWQLYLVTSNSQRKPVKEMKFIVNRIFGRLIGIKDIVFK